VYGWVIEHRRVNATTITGKVPIENGGTGADTLEQAKLKLGITGLETKISSVYMEQALRFADGMGLTPWHFRKWENGTMECWGTFKYRISTTVDASNKFASTTITNGIVFPEDFFLADEALTITATASGGGYPCVVLSYPSSVGADVLIKTEWAVTNQDIWLNVHAIGQWK
jgi:hypothetical protein